MGDQPLSSILWRGKWLVVAALVVGVGLAVLATKTSTKVYQATSLIAVNTGAAGGSATINPADVQLANQNLASTYATLITDRGFLAKIQPHVYGGQLTTGQLAARLSAHAVQSTSLVQLTAQGPSPDAARRLAGSVANAFVVNVRANAFKQTTNLQTQIQAQIARLTRQIDQLGKTSSSGQVSSLAGARSELVRQLASITASQIAAGNSVSVTAPPTGPSAAVKPRPLLNLIAGVLVGLLVGVLLAWLRTRLDRGLHSSEEAEQLLGVPLLAALPIRRQFSSEDPVLGEAFDMLRANLAFLSHEQDLRTLTLSSFNPREGKSSTVQGLAQAIVRSGMDVVMVDADVRTRSLSSRLGYENAPGLTNAIVGAAPIEDLTIELAPGLSLVAAGPMPPNPPSLFSSAAMRELLSSLSDRHGLVLIDSPPVAHLADASILASISDGVIVVARVGVTKRTDLPAAAAALRQVPTPIVGFVLLQQRQIDETYYPAVSKGLQSVSTPEAARADTLETF